MFKLLGGMLVLYTAYAAMAGSVYTKSGAWGRSVSREESPEYFWIVITGYGGLGAALLWYF